MFCSNCGSKIEDNAKFCSECGAKVEAKQEVTPIYSEPANVEVVSEVKEKGPWRGFARVGLTMGILGVIPFVNLFGFAFLGVLFSALGIPSKSRRGRAITGLVFSVIGIIMFFVILGLIEELDEVLY